MRDLDLYKAVTEDIPLLAQEYPILNPAIKLRDVDSRVWFQIADLKLMLSVQTVLLSRILMIVPSGLSQCMRNLADDERCDGVEAFPDEDVSSIKMVKVSLDSD